MKIVGARIRNIHNLCGKMEYSSGDLDSKLKVNIPHYQRPYEWGDPIKIKEKGNNLIENLFKDFYDNYDNAKNVDKSYFMGTLVAVKTNQEDDSIDIIDGQQRLTTIFLLNVLSFICKLNYINYIFRINSIFSFLRFFYFQKVFKIS